MDSEKVKDCLATAGVLMAVSGVGRVVSCNRETHCCSEEVRGFKLKRRQEGVTHLDDVVDALLFF